MLASKLKLNPDKTEFILFGSKKQTERLNACFQSTSWATPFTPTESFSQGVWFDSDFSFSKHVQKVFDLNNFRNIRQFLTQDAAVSVANASVMWVFHHMTKLPD